MLRHLIPATPQDFPAAAAADEPLTLALLGTPDQVDTLVTAMVEQLGEGPRRMLSRHLLAGTAGELTQVDLDSDSFPRLVWIPLDQLATTAARRAGAALATRVSTEVLLLTDTPVDIRAAFAEGWLLGGYTFSLRSRTPALGGSLRIPLTQPTLDRVRLNAQAVATARDLANTPGNLMDPEVFTARVTNLCSGDRMRVSVLDADHLRRKGFGGLLAVGRGSVHPPRLISITRRGPAHAPVVVLVGKGITFDSGGLSLKTPEGMTTMKTDMTGAAVVAATMLALEADPGASAAVTVVALLPIAENLPSGSAYRPGDVIRHYGGRTTEVFNTDAEGRLVLADALAYAVSKYDPAAMVDVATLTGAATMGLSRSYGALFSNDDGLATALAHAGELSGDRLWRLPLVADYRSAIASDVADVAQTPNREKVGAGAITAALYLQEFVADRPWAHLDIAGPARADKSHGVVTAGGTGFGVRALAAWLRAGPVPASA